MTNEDMKVDGAIGCGACQLLAQQVGGRTFQDFDPTDPSQSPALELIIEIVLALIEDRCDFNDPAEISNRAARQDPFDRIVVRLLLTREMGRKQFREAGGSRLVRALFEVAGNPQNLPLIQAVLEQE